MPSHIFRIKYNRTDIVNERYDHYPGIYDSAEVKTDLDRDTVWTLLCSILMLLLL